MTDSETRNFILYKPYGYLSQLRTNQAAQRKKKLLGELYEFPEGVMAIGRLDFDSEGLLLLTTSGKVSEFIRQQDIEKEYYVQLDGMITKNEIKQLEEGITIGIEGKLHHTKTSTCSILTTEPNLAPRLKPIRDPKHGPTSWASIILTEGKFRQVRKMFAQVGFPVLRLVRVRIGNIHLSEFSPSQVVEVDWFNIE